MALLVPRMTGHMVRAQARGLAHRLAGAQLLALGMAPRVVLPRPRRGQVDTAPAAPLASLLAPFGERIRRQRITIVLLRCGGGACGVAAVLALTRLVSAGAPPATVSFGALLLILGGGAALCAFQRPAPSEVARLLDRRLGLHELLGTAVELEEVGPAAEAAPSRLTLSQRERARSVLGDASASWVLPPPLLSGEMRAVGLFAAAWVILLLVGNARVNPAPTAGAHGGGAATTLARGAAATLPRAANPFAHFKGALQTVARPAAVTPQAPSPRTGTARTAGASAARANAGAGSAGGRSALAGSGRAGAALTRSGGPAALGHAAALGGAPGAHQGAGTGGLQRTSTGGAPSVGAARQTDPGSSSNLGTTSSSSSGASPQNGAGKDGSAGKSGANGHGGGLPSGMPSGSEGQANQGTRGQGEQGAAGAARGGSTGGTGSSSGSPGHRTGAAGNKPSQGGQPGAGRTGTTGAGQSGGKQRLTRSGGRLSPDAQSDPQSLMAQRPLHGGQTGAADPSLGAGQQGMTGNGGQRMPGTGGSSHVASVHDLLPNLGDENVSQNGMAFLINGQRAQGSTTDVGRANTFQPTGAPGGMIVANAPSTGAAQPGTYVAPDGNDVAPDQQALIKAYFNQTAAAH